MVVLSKRDGVAKKVTADEIVIEGDDGVTDRFKLIKYKRSNQNTCYGGAAREQGPGTGGRPVHQPG